MAISNNQTNTDRLKFGIGVHLVRFSPEESHELQAEEMLELVEMADRAGFDIVWSTEHHGHEHIVGPNPLTLLVHFAPHTEQIRLGTAVIVAPYWHPLRLAGEVAMTDILTKGRLEIGIARGAFQFEFDRMLDELPQEQGGLHLRESIPAIKKLWGGDYEHNGEIWQFPRATSVPKPVQKPHPPLWAAARSPQTFDFAVKEDMDVMTTPHRLPMSEVVDLRDKLDRAVASNPGHKRPRFLTSRMACVYEDSRDWQVPVEAIRKNVRVFMGLFNNSSGVINGFPEPVSIAEQDARGDYRPEALHENMMFGTPEEIVRKLRKYEALGVDTFNYNAHFGLSPDLARSSLELFTSEVMPHFVGGRRATIEEAFSEEELVGFREYDNEAFARVFGEVQV